LRNLTTFFLLLLLFKVWAAENWPVDRRWDEASSRRDVGKH
jgi:hypothetical protein